MTEPLHVKRADAASALADIDLIAVRVRHSRNYELASSAFVLWGVLVALAYTVTQFAPRFAPIAWPLCHVIGLILTLARGVIETRRSGRGYDPRLLLAVLIIIGFGLLWSVVLGRLDFREMSAFWPTLFMCGYVIAGLWLGRAFMVIGLAITLLTMAGYLWADRWFDLYMAVVNGGGLVLCGLWMRRS